MIIAIDLDDVLADSLNSFIEFYNKHYDKTLKYEDFIAYTLSEIKGIPREEENRILEHFDESNYFDNIKPMKDAVEVIEKLSKNHEIIIITSRTKDKEEKTKKWVNKFFKDIKRIYFIRKNYHEKPKTKAEICKEFNADVLIEDNLSYAKNCAESGVKVLLFDYPWNKVENLPPLVKRVKSWAEILNVLKKLENKDKVWRGVVLEESLENRKLLSLAKIVGTDIDKLEEENRVMTFHKVEVRDVDKQKYLDLTMYTIKSAFYTHLCKDGEMYVVFREAIFNFKKDDPELNKAREYGKSIGIIPEQMPFEHLIDHPFD